MSCGGMWGAVGGAFLGLMREGKGWDNFWQLEPCRTHACNMISGTVSSAMLNHRVAFATQKEKSKPDGWPPFPVFPHVPRNAPHVWARH